MFYVHNPNHFANSMFSAPFEQRRWGVRPFQKNCEKRLVASSCLFLNSSASDNSAITGRIFMKFDILVFFEKTVENIQVTLKYNKNNGYFTWMPMYICDNTSISLDSSWNQKYFRQDLLRKLKKKNYEITNRCNCMQSILFHC